jgi:tetratricopeptide (TPR) repeat protein
MAIQLEEAELTAAANRAFAVGLSCVPKAPVNWFRGRGQDYRKEGNFLKADIAFRFGVKHANARNSPGEAAFSQVSLGRQRYNVKDLEGAVPYLRNAVQLADGWYDSAKINYEYGKLLRQLGRDDDAEKYLQASVQHWDKISESQANNSFLTPAMVDTFRLSCQLLMRGRESVRQRVIDFVKDETVAGSYRGLVLAHAIKVYGESDVDLEYAAALLECSLHALGHPLTGHEMVIDAYVQVMDQLGRIDRAFANLNRYRYVFCDLRLDRTNFRRADFRKSIAEAMMARGIDPQKSKRLLSQAKEILEYNPLTPQQKLNDLDRLIAECDDAIQADRPLSSQDSE